MKCDWWPTNAKRPCKLKATWKMFQGQAFLAGLCLMHKKDAVFHSWPNMTFKRMRRYRKSGKED